MQRAGFKDFDGTVLPWSSFKLGDRVPTQTETGPLKTQVSMNGHSNFLPSVNVTEGS